MSREPCDSERRRWLRAAPGNALGRRYGIILREASRRSRQPIHTGKRRDASARLHDIRRGRAEGRPLSGSHGGLLRWSSWWTSQVSGQDRDHPAPKPAAQLPELRSLRQHKHYGIAAGTQNGLGQNDRAALERSDRRCRGADLRCRSFDSRSRAKSRRLSLRNESVGDSNFQIVGSEAARDTARGADAEAGSKLAFATADDERLHHLRLAVQRMLSGQKSPGQ
jgi:hypothetical protein